MAGNSLSFRQQTLLQQAVGLHQNGRLAEAGDIYMRLLRAVPSNPEVLCLLGNAQYHSGNAEEGARLLGKSLLVAPKYPKTWFNRGTMLMDIDRVEEALACYDKALALKPDFVEAYVNRGSALQRLKRFEDAIDSYDKALSLQPDYAQAWNNRGNALQDLYRPVEAMVSFDRALALKPDYARAHYNRGCILPEVGRPEEALACFDTAIRLSSNYGGPYERALLDPDQLDDVVASYEGALAETRAWEELLGHALHTRMRLADWVRFGDLRAPLVRRMTGGERVAEPFSAHAVLDSPLTHLKVTEIHSASRYPHQGLLPLLGRHPRHERIRVGYVSSDFRDHPVSHLLAGLFEAHDRTKVEAFVFAAGAAPVRDIWRQRIEATAEHFIDISAMSDIAVTRRMRELEIDIAIDLNGFTEGGRAGIFAERAAPVQASYLGYCGTMGADYYDYLFADPVLIPETHQAFYVEKIAYLPSYQINDDTRVVSDRVFSRSELGLPETGFVFCAFNQTYKIIPDVFDSWMRILAKVQGSVLWLAIGDATARRNLQAEAQARGIDGGRLVFAERIEAIEDHLARHRQADLFLDTHPYNAMVTASNALRAGLPVLTRVGESFAARMGASLLTAVGLPELITQTPEAYEALAVQLATHPDQLAAIKQKLADNLPACALFDTTRCVRALETAYSEIYERHCDELPPENIGAA